MADGDEAAEAELSAEGAAARASQMAAVEIEAWEYVHEVLASVVVADAVEAAVEAVEATCDEAAKAAAAAAEAEIARALVESCLLEAQSGLLEAHTPTASALEQLSRRGSLNRLTQEQRAGGFWGLLGSFLRPCLASGVAERVSVSV